MKKFSVEIILIICTALSTWIITIQSHKSYQNELNRPREFGQLISITPVDYTTLEENNVKTFHDGKQIHGYNDIKVTLYNYEDKSFDDVQVYIKVKPQAGDSLKLMGVIINKDKEIIQPIKDSLGCEKGNLEFRYNIKHAIQTTDYNKSVFDINIQIISSKPLENPEVKLSCSTLNPVPEPQGKSWERFTEVHSSFFDTVFGGILMVISLGAIIVLTIGKTLGWIFRPSEEKRFKKEIEMLTSKVGEKITNGEINSSDYKKIIEEYFKIKKTLEYENASPFGRWANNLRKPE